MLETISGHELSSSIKTAASRLGIESGFVRAFGFVRDAQLRVDGQLIEASAATLVSLSGSVTSSGSKPVFRATAVLSYMSGGVPILVGGELVSAFADGVECWFDGVGDPAVSESKPPRRDGPAPRHAKPKPAPAAVATPELPFESSQPEKVEAPIAKAPRPERPQARVARPQPAAAPAAPKAKASPGNWARVLEASQSVAEDEDDGEVDVDELERGNVLLHPSLAECTILAVISDDAVKVTLPNGSVRKLVMRNFRLFAEGDGKFRVEKRKKA